MTFASMNILAALTSLRVIVAQIEDPAPSLPAPIAGDFTTLLSWSKGIGLVVLGIGAIFIAVQFAISRDRGEGMAEGGGRLLKVGIGAAIVGSIISILNLLVV